MRKGQEGTRGDRGEDERRMEDGGRREKEEGGGRTNEKLRVYGQLPSLKLNISSLEARHLAEIISKLVNDMVVDQEEGEEEEGIRVEGEQVEGVGGERKGGEGKEGLEEPVVCEPSLSSSPPSSALSPRSSLFLFLLPFFLLPSSSSLPFLRNPLP
jgi:hypothetical protein